jgi:hypothetical protein
MADAIHLIDLAEQELSVPVKPAALSLVIFRLHAGEDVYHGDLRSKQLAGQMVGHGCGWNVDYGPKIWLTLANLLLIMADLADLADFPGRTDNSTIPLGFRF